MTRKLLPLTLLAASTLFATPDFGFEGDTTLTLGEKTVPLKVVTTVDTSTYPDSSAVWDTLYRDSLDRELKWDHWEVGLEDSVVVRKAVLSLLTAGDTVSSVRTDESIIGAGFNRNGVDSLIGEEWNSVGMITAGMRYRRRNLNSTEHGSAQFSDTDRVFMIYDL